MSDGAPSVMSLRAYAKRRGVSVQAVSMAIKAGRLVASVARDGFGNPKIANPDLADQEWAANTEAQKRANAAGGDPTELPDPVTDTTSPLPSPPSEPDLDAPAASEPVTLATSAAHAKFWDAKLKELKFREAAREVIPAQDVEQRMADVFSTCRVKLLALPSRIKQALPHLTTGDTAAIDDLVREALEDLADGGPAEPAA